MNNTTCHIAHAHRLSFLGLMVLVISLGLSHLRPDLPFGMLQAELGISTFLVGGAFAILSRKLHNKGR